MGLAGLKVPERAEWHIRTLTPEKEEKRAGERGQGKTAGSPQAHLAVSSAVTTPNLFGSRWGLQKR